MNIPHIALGKISMGLMWFPPATLPKRMTMQKGNQQKWLHGLELANPPCYQITKDNDKIKRAHWCICIFNVKQGHFHLHLLPSWYFASILFVLSNSTQLSTNQYFQSRKSYNHLCLILLQVQFKEYIIN